VSDQLTDCRRFRILTIVDDCIVDHDCQQTVSSRFVPDLSGYAPVLWLLLSGLVLMAAIAIGTTFTIDKFRESAIEIGKQGLESAVLLLARHF
jgi:hypothetical protein